MKLFFSLLEIGLFSCLTSSAGAQTQPLKVVFPSFSGAFTPLWVAHDLGLFAKHGVEIQPVFIEGDLERHRLLLRGMSISVSSRAA